MSDSNCCFLTCMQVSQEVGKVPVIDCLLQMHGSAVACCGESNSGCSRLGRCSIWHEFSWRRLLLALPKSCLADPQTGEQLYQRSSHTVAKVLGPTTDFPTWWPGKRTENPQRIWLWKPVGFNYRTSTGLGKQTLGGYKKNLVCSRSQEKGAVPWQETEPDFPVSVQESLGEAWVDSQGHWIQQSWEPWHAARSPSEGGHHYHHYPYHSLASGQTTEKKQPFPSVKNWTKDLLSMALPLEQDPDSPKPVPPIRKFA